MESDELPLAHPTELNLWELTEENDNAIQAPLDPAEYGIDPAVTTLNNAQGSMLRGQRVHHSALSIVHWAL
jgi:hypothetical protein